VSHLGVTPLDSLPRVASRSCQLPRDQRKNVGARLSGLPKRNVGIMRGHHAFVRRLIAPITMRLVLPLCLAALSPSVLTAQHAPEPLPVLIVSGANNHDWGFTSESLAQMLDTSGKFAVRLTNDPSAAFADLESLSSFRALVLDYNGPRWGAQAEKNFLEAVRGGVGVVIVHAANNAFEGWVEYETLVGLLWRKGTGHGRFHPFDVQIQDRSHPLTATLPTLRQHPDELYHRLVHMHDADFTVLATAFSDKETGGTGENEPMIIVSQYGAGRVFHTPLGHVWPNSPDSRVSHADAQFQNLIVQGTEWAATGSISDGLARPNQLSERDQRAGWKLLFDGATTAGWRSVGGSEFPAQGWQVVNGCLVHSAGGSGGDIATTRDYSDFELEFEWKVAALANSGVKYRINETGGRRSALGPEYQLADLRHPNSAHPKQRSAALYDVHAAESSPLELTGSFNHSRIVARAGRIEHWLNGERCVLADATSQAWEQHIAASKFKDIAGFGLGTGAIALQDHGDEVWFRSLRLRDWTDMPGTRHELFNGEDTSGWSLVGDASYVADQGSILGTVTGGAQSFLISDRTFADFIFEVEVKTELEGNSGIQVRSKLSDKGRVTGYQIEIDPSDRAWSGGLYDEARRGWLDNLEDNPAGRAAYRHGEWNQYRIECIGNTIRAWVNGVPTAEFVDDADAEGFIGLQVHSGDNTRVRWRNLVLWEL